MNKAVIRALEVLEDYEGAVAIRTDSKYVVLAMTKWICNWRKSPSKYDKVANQDLFKRLDALCSARSTPVIFVSSSGAH